MVSQTARIPRKKRKGWELLKEIPLKDGSLWIAKKGKRYRSLFYTDNGKYSHTISEAGTITDVVFEGLLENNA